MMGAAAGAATAASHCIAFSSPSFWGCVLFICRANVVAPPGFDVVVCFILDQTAVTAT